MRPSELLGPSPAIAGLPPRMHARFAEQRHIPARHRMPRSLLALRAPPHRGGRTSASSRISIAAAPPLAAITMPNRPGRPIPADRRGHRATPEHYYRAAPRGATPRLTPNRPLRAMFLDDSESRVRPFCVGWEVIGANLEPRPDSPCLPRRNGAVPPSVRESSDAGSVTTVRPPATLSVRRYAAWLFPFEQGGRVTTSTGPGERCFARATVPDETPHPVAR